MGAVIVVGFYLLVVIGAFLLYGAVATCIYTAVIKNYGVTENIVKRSAKIGSITAGLMITTFIATDFLIGSFGLVLSMVVTTYYSGNYLRKNITIKPWIAYFAALGVVCISGIVFLGLMYVFGFE